MDHDCLDCLEYRQEYCRENLDVEVDGAIEVWWDEWWECTICGDRFTAKELEAILGAIATGGQREAES